MVVTQNLAQPTFANEMSGNGDGLTSASREVSEAMDRISVIARRPPCQAMGGSRPRGRASSGDHRGCRHSLDGPKQLAKTPNANSCLQAHYLRACDYFRTSCCGKA